MKEMTWRHQGQWRKRGRRYSRHQSQDSSEGRGDDHNEAAVSLSPGDPRRMQRYTPAHGRGGHAGVGECLEEAVI